MSSTQRIAEDVLSTTPSQSRLTLHIPNAYPRSLTSPRSASPSSPRPLQNTESEARIESGANNGILGNQSDSSNDQSDRLRFFQQARYFLQSQKTTDESARDFLARERTFFSWLRLSTMLAVASAALFFRLQIKSLSGVLKKRGTSRDFRHLHAALQRETMRKNMLLSQPNPYQRPFTLSANLQINEDLTIYTEKNADKSILDTNVVLSRGLGIAFLIVALACLAVGYFDYIRCERALEHADRVVPLTGRNGDDGHPDHVERREVARKWHDGRMAKDAHSSVIVHITEITAAALIFATALIILITSQQASLAPLPP